MRRRLATLPLPLRVPWRSGLAGWWLEGGQGAIFTSTISRPKFEILLIFPNLFFFFLVRTPRPPQRRKCRGDFLISFYFKSWVIGQLKFVTLDILVTGFVFFCGESKRYKNFVRYQNVMIRIVGHLNNRYGFTSTTINPITTKLGKMVGLHAIDLPCKKWWCHE